MEKSNSIINISFNQDNSCFSLATETGFKIYQTYPFKGPYERKMKGGIGNVQMLYKSNFLAMLGGGKAPIYNNNKVVIWDENKTKVISELKFITKIINIKLKKDLLFVICEERIYLFNLNTYDIIDTIDTGKNLKGLIAINADPSFNIIAYPSIKGLDNITIRNFKIKRNKCINIALEEIINFMTINYDGTLLAISNEGGTLIKIYSCIDGSYLKQYKRGHDRVENIYLCFDNENKFLAISSSKGTIHIFSLSSTLLKLKKIEKKNEKLIDSNKIKDKVRLEKNEEKEKEKEKNNEKIELFKLEEDIEEDDLKNKEEKNINIINNKKELKIPENTKSIFGNEICFAKFKIKPQRNICTFIRSNILIIITFNNKYYQVEIDMKKGYTKLLLEKNI